ncbi:MAG: glutaredoxin domain-containing protein [Campylobacterota bacterium]|nr:glutaredoxin domain-containing protein [Campylobacterota bacterium]
MKPVALFTAPKCKWCGELKQYLKSKKIKFNVVDVSKNKAALNDCQKNGCRGVPVLLIGNKWICGFDKQKINKTLGIK